MWIFDNERTAPPSPYTKGEKEFKHWQKSCSGLVLWSLYAWLSTTNLKQLLMPSFYSLHLVSGLSSLVNPYSSEKSYKITYSLNGVRMTSPPPPHLICIPPAQRSLLTLRYLHIVEFSIQIPEGVHQLHSRCLLYLSGIARLPIAYRRKGKTRDKVLWMVPIFQ